jgi:hypothetical protein
MLNGEPPPPPLLAPMWSKTRGPLSSMLFMLVSNTRNMLLEKSIELGILQRLARRELSMLVSLYAHDVVIFSTRMI